MLQDRFSLLLYRICVLGCLIGLAATVYLLSGWAGYVGSPIPNVALAGVFILATAYFLYIFFVSLEISWLGFLLWLSILLLLAVEIALGLLPPTARDELTHHLAVPKLYASAGKIYEIPFDFPSYYPMLLDMLFTPWVKWGWDFIPKLIHGLFGFLTGILLYLYLAHRLSPIYGLLGFLLFVSTPAIVRLSNWAYVDLGLVFYSTASLLCLLQWVEAREIRDPQPSSIRDPHSRWLLLAGLSAGFAASTKPNGLLALLLLFLLVAWGLGRGGKDKIRGTVYHLTLFFLVALVALSPWFLRNFAWTGNPLFPFFPSLFGGGGGGGGGAAALGILAKRRLLYGESGWEIAALPLRIFFLGRDDNPQYFDGVLNPILILFLPWAFKGKWFEEKKIFFTFALLYFLFAFFLAEIRIRYILPIVPPLVILLVYGIHNVYLRIVRPSLLFAALIFLSAFNVVYSWDYFHKVSPMGYLFGKESREDYLSRSLPDYPAFRFINQNLPDSARIYLIFMGRRVYYCERPYFHDGGDIPWILLRTVQKAQTGDRIKASFVERGLTHLLVREELLRRFFGDNLTSAQQQVWDSFAMHHLRILYKDRGYSLYQIYG